MSKRTLCALLAALTVLTCTAPAASAASAPSVTYRSSGGGVSLSVGGVNGGVYGAQLTLTVPGSHVEAVFTPAGGDVYSPACTVEESGGSTRITIYLTAENPMNSGSTLPLGTLNLNGASLPSSGELTLLNRGLTVSSSGAVALRPASSGNGGNSGSSRPSSGKDDKDQPGQEETPDYTATVLPFGDTSRGEWYYSAVQYVYARGMMSGTTATAFSPGGTTTRGMIVTILHRLEGSPAAAEAAFPDVDQSLTTPPPSPGPALGGW